MWRFPVKPVGLGVSVLFPVCIFVSQMNKGLLWHFAFLRLCFLVKLMNEITAEADGVISQVCVSDGQMIEYGTELFKIEC